MVRHVTFDDDQPEAEETPLTEPERPAQPETPARQQQQPPEVREVTVPAASPANRRPARERKAPAYLRDYELSEMSVVVRRPASYMVEDVGVGGMLDNDIPESRLREISRGADAGRAGADVTSGTGQPEACDRREKKLPRVRDILLGLRKTCQENGLNEAFTAFLVGRLALDLCDVDPPI